MQCWYAIAKPWQQGHPPTCLSFHGEYKSGLISTIFKAERVGQHKHSLYEWYTIIPIELIMRHTPFRTFLKQQTQAD